LSVRLYTVRKREKGQQKKGVPYVEPRGSMKMTDMTKWFRDGSTKRLIRVAGRKRKKGERK